MKKIICLLMIVFSLSSLAMTKIEAEKILREKYNIVKFEDEMLITSLPIKAIYEEIFICMEALGYKIDEMKRYSDAVNMNFKKIK